MYRICISLLFLTAVTTRGAVMRGTITENASGNALAGTLVTLQPISPAGAPASTRAGESGDFEFSSLPAGAYIVTGSRRGFLPLQYGQRQWNSAGTPVVLADDGVAFLNLRLHRPGAVTGLVRDENDVGMAGHEVVAYINTEPPQIAGRAHSDDRGVYRISGLNPGTYLIRTTGSASPDASYIPTFSRQTLRTEDAQQVQVYLDEDSKGIDIRPAEGKLFRLAGSAPVPEGYSVTITLASDMGRRVTKSTSFDWNGLPPGPYEIYAEARAGSARLPAKGAWSQFNLTKDTQGFTLSMQDVQPAQFEFAPREERLSSKTSVIARRKDLAGSGTPELLTLSAGRALIFPGRWEMIAIPPDGFYVSQFSSFGRGKGRPDGWNEVIVQYFTSIRITISGAAPSLHGVVKAAGEPVPGAPVFLEAWDPNSRRRMVELRSTRSEANGSYLFKGIPPGIYRLLSSFEYLIPDSAAIDLTSPRVLEIEPHSDLTVDLDLYGIR